MRLELWEVVEDAKFRKAGSSAAAGEGVNITWGLVSLTEFSQSRTRFVEDVLKNRTQLSVRTYACTMELWAGPLPLQI